MNARNQILSGIRERRSIREFTSDTVPHEDLEKMLSAMEAAPSAGNLQPWKFQVILNPEVKKKLFLVSFSQQALVDAPVVFAISAYPSKSAEKYGHTGMNLFCIQDTACVCQNLMLAAHSLGYGSVWIGVVHEQQVAAVLELESTEKPAALIAVGKPKSPGGVYERIPWRKITTFIE